MTKNCTDPKRCGKAGRKEYCDACLAVLREAYPQGWHHYAGDTCEHGVYVGGMGVDYMCGRCEMGDDDDEPEPDDAKNEHHRDRESAAYRELGGKGETR
jgi:hypothetical protein